MAQPRRGKSRKSGGKKNAKKRRPGVGEVAVVQKLQQVRETRAVFRDLGSKIIAETLEQYASVGQIVEVGAGDGQLIEWLAPDLRSRMLHTEPLSLGVKRLQAAFPEVNVRQASAESLPFSDGDVDTLTALCVFDVLKDGPAAAAEFARVLKPGGRVIHFLDMSADPYAPILQMQASKLMLYPNVFSDPCAAEWPEDMFVAPIGQMVRLVEILERARHPTARALRKYLALFQATPFSASRTAAAYTDLLEDGQAKLAWLNVLRTASEVATAEERAELARFQGQAVSSARHLEVRLRQWFSKEAGFETESSTMFAKSAHVSPEQLPEGSTVRQRGARYASIAAGHVRVLDDVPEYRLTSGHLDADPTPDQAEQPDRNQPHQIEQLDEITKDPEETVLLEQSIFVFVARRTAQSGH